MSSYECTRIIIVADAETKEEAETRARAAASDPQVAWEIAEIAEETVAVIERGSDGRAVFHPEPVRPEEA